MPEFEDGSYSSLKGLSLISKVLAGRCQMKYTRAAVGKGYIPEGESPGTMTAPADYVMDAQIAAVSNPIDGECQVTVQVNSNDAQTGFFATCIVLYADDPDEGEIPYTYLVLENGPEWIRPQSSDVGKIASFDIIAAVGEVQRVTAEIDPDSLVTRQMVQDIVDDVTVGIVIGSTEPLKNNVFWFDTSVKKIPDVLKINMDLVSNSSDTEINASIDDTLYGVKNAGTGTDSELNFTIY